MATCSQSAEGKHTHLPKILQDLGVVRLGTQEVCERKAEAYTKQTPCFDGYYREWVGSSNNTHTHTHTHTQSGGSRTPCLPPEEG